MSLFLDALECKNTNRPPVWLMRQAGRYMTAYQKIRANHSLYELFHIPEKIIEITQQPVQSFGMDAAILFSDILTVFDGLGVEYSFEEGIGPVVHSRFFHRNDSKNAYAHIDTSIRHLREQLCVPLIGFVGGPFTVLSYLIEGKTSREFLKIKTLLYQEPQTFQALLNAIVEETLRYLDVQISAGAQAIQVFDSWAHVLSFTHFCDFVLEPMRKIVHFVQERDVPIILFCRGSSYFAPLLAELKPQAISLDWNANLVEIRSKIPKTIALQGNFDPLLLLAPQETIEKTVEDLLTQMEEDPGYIVNLGHGVHRNTKESHVRLFVDTVKHFTSKARSV